MHRSADDHLPPDDDENDVNGEDDDDGDENDDDEEEVDVDGTANAGSSRRNAGDRSNASPRRERSSVNPAARAKARRDRESYRARTPRLRNEERRASPVHCAAAVRRSRCGRAGGVYIYECRETWTREIEISIGLSPRARRFNQDRAPHGRSRLAETLEERQSGRVALVPVGCLHRANEDRGSAAVGLWTRADIAIASGKSLTIRALT